MNVLGIGCGTCTRQTGSVGTTYYAIRHNLYFLRGLGHETSLAFAIELESRRSPETVKGSHGQSRVPFPLPLHPSPFTLQNPQASPMSHPPSSDSPLRKVVGSRGCGCTAGLAGTVIVRKLQSPGKVSGVFFLLYCVWACFVCFGVGKGGRVSLYKQCSEKRA